ncbi:MAG: hypothetical protein KJO99_00585 [Nitrosopumilus sp.]|nr:hypothetical protein [Nitrosopumilus sp.]NNL52486.1 hypothetical protein [Nitrosopumilus sp.]
MVSTDIRKLAGEVFKMDSQISHIGLIDLEGHVLLDQSAGQPEPMEPSNERIMFYYQVGLRRSRREHFNREYGETNYIHIVREKTQQVVLYLPMITIYLTIDKSVSPEGIANIAKDIQNIDKLILDKAIKSMFYSQ